MTIIYVKVANISGGTDTAPPDGSPSWFDFWKEKNPFYEPSSCSNRDCGVEGPLFGGHVQVLAEPQKRYVIPLCASCAALQDEFEVAEYKLTPVKG